ncbi:MAG TPA: Ig-like domain-containing protein [Vicinamibacteria bacterium]
MTDHTKTIKTVRGVGKVLLFLAFLRAEPVLAQGLGIEHEAPGCLIADKHPRLRACFAPRPEVSRARVYFRAVGTTDWYYVEMAPDTPCFAGVLPKPRRSIAGVDYYLSVLDRSFTESRTAEFAPVVVREEKDCPKGLAPYVSSAPVTVGSALGAAALPSGFAAAGAVPAALVAGVVGGGVALAGGAVVVAGGGEETTTTTLAVAGTLPTTLAVAPTTTTTLPGTPTTTTLPGTPTTTTTTTTLVPTTLPTPPPTTTPANACASDATPPTVEITSPGHGPLPGLSAVLRADAADASGVAQVRFYFRDQPNDPRIAIATVTTAPWQTSWSFPGCSVSDTVKLTAVARDACGNEAESRATNVNLSDRPCAAATPAVAAALPVRADLQVPGATGQIVVGGAQAFFVAAGGTMLSPSLPAREASGRKEGLRFEASLVDGAGQAGTWRFEVGPGASLRAVAGDVVLATPQALVFRLRGRPGDRIVFIVEPQR